MKLQQMHHEASMKPLQCTSSPHLLHNTVKGPLRDPAAIRWGGSVIHLGTGRCVQELLQVLERNCSYITNVLWEN